MPDFFNDKETTIDQFLEAGGAKTGNKAWLVAVNEKLSGFAYQDGDQNSDNTEGLPSLSTFQHLTSILSHDHGKLEEELLQMVDATAEAYKTEMDDHWPTRAASCGLGLMEIQISVSLTLSFSTDTGPTNICSPEGGIIAAASVGASWKMERDRTKEGCPLGDMELNNAKGSLSVTGKIGKLGVAISGSVKLGIKEDYKFNPWTIGVELSYGPVSLFKGSREEKERKLKLIFDVVKTVVETVRDAVISSAANDPVEGSDGLYSMGREVVNGFGGILQDSALDALFPDASLQTMGVERLFGDSGTSGSELPGATSAVTIGEKETSVALSVELGGTKKGCMYISVAFSANTETSYVVKVKVGAGGIYFTDGLSYPILKVQWPERDGTTEEDCE